MANQLVTDLDAIITLPDSGIIHVIDTTVTTQNAAGSSFKITKANLLKENTAAILLNTAKVGITPTQATAITNNTNKVGYTDALVTSATSVVLNTAKVGITPSQTSAITANTSKVGYTEALVNANTSVVANTAKVGITSGQSSAITVNTAKVGYTDALVTANSSVTANTAKTGISPAQATAITTNSAKVGITTAQSDAILLNTANTSKVSVNNDAASLANVRSLRYREETYSSNLDMVMQSSVGVYAWVNVFTIAFNVVNSLVTRFKTRVATDSGTFENQTALETFLGTITSSLTTVLAAITPNAFKAGKLYSVIPNTSALDATVVRNTTATRINSLGYVVLEAANVARIDYPPLGGAGFILDEPQRINLIPFSRDLTNAYWLKDNLTTSTSAILSPDNINTALKIVENSATIQHRIGSNLILNSGAASVYSFWVKAAERRFVYLRGNIDANVNVNINLIGFDVQTATFNVVASGVTARSKAFLNGWYKVSVSFTSAQANPTFYIGMSDVAVTSSTNPSYAGNGTSGLFLWNEMHELGALETSDIFTNGAAVTRNADVITLAPPTGTVKITTTFSDNSTQVLTTIPATYTLPEGLTKSVNFNNTL